MNLLVTVIAQEQHTAGILTPLLGNECVVYSSQIAAMTSATREIGVVVATTADATLIIDACDAVVLVVDGETGLSPLQLENWLHAVEMSVPRIVVSYNAVNTRADFDEVVAIAERMLAEDILVRYLPVVSDDESALVGQFDVLTGDIVDHTTGQSIRRAGDPEHMQLTYERREDLVETLAHFSDDDTLMMALESGMPMNTPALERAFTGDDIVTVIAIDNGVGIDALTLWFEARTPRWEPNIERDGEIATLEGLNHRIGYGITNGIARTWGPSHEVLECSCSFDIDSPVLVACESIAQGQSLYTPGHQVSLTAPAF